MGTPFSSTHAVVGVVRDRTAVRAALGIPDDQDRSDLDGLDLTPYWDHGQEQGLTLLLLRPGNQSDGRHVAEGIVVGVSLGSVWVDNVGAEALAVTPAEIAAATGKAAAALRPVGLLADDGDLRVWLVNELLPPG